MRKEIKKDEIAPARVDTVSEMSYGGSIGTETVSDDYSGGTSEDHIKNPIHQGFNQTMHEGAKGDIPTLRSRDINLVTKYVNEVNEVLK